MLARLQAIEGDFDTAARVLAGKDDGVTGATSHRASPTETPAQARARLTSALLNGMDHDLRLLVRTVPTGNNAPLARIFYADVRRRARLLLRGTKTLRTELKRLRQEKHSFAR